MNKIILNQQVEIEIAKISKVAAFIWDKGWAERSGGNISVNFTEIMSGPEDYAKFEYVKIANFPRELSDKIFFVTGTGERIRDLDEPAKISCIIQFDEKVQGYHILWGGEKKAGFRPTSELISHVKIHLELGKTDKKYTAVLHSHPTEMICLSHHPKLNKNEKLFNDIIWSMLPEVRVFVPRGVALLPYALPGSEKLADMTVKALRKRDIALWSKHGALVAGQDIIEAFDLLDVANKGCYIYMKCLASGFIPEGMAKNEIVELERVFNL